MSSKKNDSGKAPPLAPSLIRDRKIYPLGLKGSGGSTSVLRSVPGDNSERKENIKTNFLLMIQEILSSSEELCRGVEVISGENKIFRDSPKDRCRLVKLIIKKRADVSKGVGIAANLPSAVSIVGMVAATAVTSTVEFISLIRLMTEMCLEIAYVYGKELDRERLIEALAIIGCHQHDKKDFQRLDEAALKSGVKKAVKSYVKKGALLMAERVVMRIELATLKKRLSRFIPFLSMPIAAVMNYREALSVGRMAEMYYQ